MCCIFSDIADISFAKPNVSNPTSIEKLVLSVQGFQPAVRLLNYT